MIEFTVLLTQNEFREFWHWIESEKLLPPISLETFTLLDPILVIFRKEYEVPGVDLLLVILFSDQEFHSAI
jgi:hypothetical protein